MKLTMARLRKGGDNMTFLLMVYAHIGLSPHPSSHPSPGKGTHDQQPSQAVTLLGVSPVAIKASALLLTKLIIICLRHDLLLRVTTWITLYQKSIGIL